MANDTVPYLNKKYYTIQQIARILGWTTHNVSQRSRLARFERVAAGVYTQESVDRYLLARELTAQAAKDGRRSPHLLWPDQHGAAEWEGKTYRKQE